MRFLYTTHEYVGEYNSESSGLKLSEKIAFDDDGDALIDIKQRCYSKDVIESYSNLWKEGRRLEKENISFEHLKDMLVLCDESILEKPYTVAFFFKTEYGYVYYGQYATKTTVYISNRFKPASDGVKAELARLGDAYLTVNEL